MENRIALCIATFKRPMGLKRLLDSVEKINFNGNLSVIVVDNDAKSKEGYKACKEIESGGYRWPITCVIEPKPGIAPARNALVKAALQIKGIEFIAMVDDDEFVEPQWIDELLRVQAETDADIVGGAALPFSDKPFPDWAIEGKFYELPRYKDGPVDMVNGTNNLHV